MPKRDEPKVLEEEGPPASAAPDTQSDSPKIEEQPDPGVGEAVYIVVGAGDEFDSRIEGVPVITRQGSPVPDDKADELKAVAKANDVTIRKVG